MFNHDLTIPDMKVCTIIKSGAIFFFLYSVINFLQDTGKTIKPMGMENLSMQMEMSTRASGRMTKQMEREFTFMLMEQSMVQRVSFNSKVQGILEGRQVAR